MGPRGSLDVHVLGDEVQTPGRLGTRSTGAACISEQLAQLRECGAMATVQEDILKAFYEKLGKLDTLDKAGADAIRKILEGGQKLKAEDFAKILAKSPKGGVA